MGGGETFFDRLTADQTPTKTVLRSFRHVGCPLYTSLLKSFIVTNAIYDCHIVILVFFNVVFVENSRNRANGFRKLMKSY